jgi:hypothetical protein
VTGCRCTDTRQCNDGLDTTPKTSCISNVPQTMDDVQHDVSLTNRPLSQTVRELSETTVFFIELAVELIPSHWSEFCID